MGKPDFKTPSTQAKSKTSEKKSSSDHSSDKKKDTKKLQPLVATKVLALNVEDVLILTDDAYRCFMYALDEACKLWMKKEFVLNEDFIEEMETQIGVVQIALLMFRARTNCNSVPPPRFKKEDWLRLNQPFSMKTFAEVAAKEYRPASPAVKPENPPLKKKKSSAWADQVEEQDPSVQMSRMDISSAPPDHTRSVTPQARSRRRIRVDPGAVQRVTEKRIMARNLAERSQDLKGLTTMTVSSTQAKSLLAECYSGYVPLVLVDRTSFDTIGDNKYVAVDYEIHEWKRVLPPFIVTTDEVIFGGWCSDLRYQAPPGLDLSKVSYDTTYGDVVALGSGAP